MNRVKHTLLGKLMDAGITWDDARALRRIAMTLHSWHEKECGTNHGCIERDEETSTPYWVSSMVMRRTRIADRESGAHRRLAAIMARYPTLVSYVQGDPRGAALYILRTRDVPDGGNVEAYYTRGLAVHK